MFDSRIMVKVTVMFSEAETLCVGCPVTDPVTVMGRSSVPEVRRVVESLDDISDVGVNVIGSRMEVEAIGRLWVGVAVYVDESVPSVLVKFKVELAV